MTEPRTARRSGKNRKEKRGRMSFRILGLEILVGLLSGCAYVNVTTPLDTDLSETKLASYFDAACGEDEDL